MKLSINTYLFLVLVFVSVVSCRSNEPKFEYKYNLNPEYSWGQAEFYGTYYADVDIDLNVLTLSLFSDSFYVYNQQLAGFGQYLFLEDVFIPLGDTILPDGVYRADTLAQPFTFFPGEQLKVDGNSFDVGAFIYYIEKRSAFSMMKYIARGQFEVKTIGGVQSIVCDFVMSDSTKITGKFSGQLPYFDQSLPTVHADERMRHILIQKPK